MKKTLLLLIISVIGLLAQQTNSEKDKYFSEIKKQAIEESLIPIRPGKPNEFPFWNEKSTMFIYAPSFNFNNSSWVIQTPEYYKYTAFSFENNTEYNFNANSPFQSISPIWDKIPAGKIYLKVEALSNDEKIFNLAGSRIFYKSEPFSPPYPNAKYDYQTAFEKGLNFQINQIHVQNWLKEAKPDHRNHQLYCYSALEVGSVINSMILYHKHFPNDEKSIQIAQTAADYLIKNSEKIGKPLEFFPQIYEGKELSANRFSDEMIITEPSSTAISYLELYEITKNEKYFNAAVNIAKTYKKNQLENGTWNIRIEKNTGKPTTDELCIPIRIADFMDILVNKYNLSEFEQVKAKAINWIWENPMKTYNWTGQFEDVEAQKMYANLTKYEASWFAQYLFKNSDKDSNYIKLGKELVAFCEDQFVVWQNPKIYDTWGNSSKSWRTPSVLEQYACYVPIDASLVQMIDTFLSAFTATKEQIYYEKAIALANSIVNAQDENGKIATFWASGFHEFWNNCMVSDLQMLNRIIEINKEVLK